MVFFIVNNVIHFIEVKTGSFNNTNYETSDIGYSSVSHETHARAVSHETLNESETQNSYSLEENVHHWKQKRMNKAIKTYIEEKVISDDQEWQIDIIAVKLDFSTKSAIIRHTEDVVFEI